MTNAPIVLCIGGHDPSGGAGIQADIETVDALAGRAVTLVTALTTQDTHNIHALHPTGLTTLAAQWDLLTADMPPRAIKIGLLGSTAAVDWLAARLARFEGPVVLDPVLAAGGGFELDRGDLAVAIRAQLLPHVTLLTPNRAEARRLAQVDDVDTAAARLLAAGARAVLVTGADEADGEQVRNTLFERGGSRRDYEWPRLPHRYHGSGCTLAAACAARLAAGDPLREAVAAAQRFTWASLAGAEQAGRGQWLPVRRA